MVVAMHDLTSIERPEAASPADCAGDVTPMMAQFLAIKRRNPDCLLFYRMGDFYEMFFDDAVAAAEALGIALTRRGKHLGEDIPMCGVPVHSHDVYLARLIRKGFKVAVCEQMENPAEAKKRGAKSVVRRDVVRLVTPGTLTEDTLLDARRHNFLGAAAEVRGELGLAWIDVSTGDFQTQAVALNELGAVLARLDAGELLISETFMQKPELFETLNDWRERLTSLPSSCFDSENARKRLQLLYQVKTMDAFGEFSRAETAAGGALVDYVELTQKGKMPCISRPRRLERGAVMEIDAATRRNLELTVALSGEREGSLLDVIDRTLTGAGARLLAARLAAPLTDPAAIGNRLDMVQFFVDDERLRESVRGLLKRCPDLERALSRLTVGRGGPRDLAAVRDALAVISSLREALKPAEFQGIPDGVAACMKEMGFHGELVDRLTRALGPEPGLYARDGGFIAAGYAPELDELITLRDESRRLIANLQGRYAAETAIQALKIKHNNVLGYYIEVAAGQAERMPTGADAPFIHRQTIANKVRYATVELGELEGKIARAAEQALALELKLFEDLTGEIIGRSEAVALAARAAAALDAASALAQLAADRNYSRPVVTAGRDFEITGGRHPVVEAALEKSQDGVFVANDCDLGNERRLWLLTGPNMAGKSTFLRQNALIAVLAQMGSYVPAHSARIGAVDRLFSRVGAADDLARGRSTFMVEMVETAAILNMAGPGALVILDEIGRGTATFDGLSIAWAVVEHLHETNRCRGLFATHYHELTSLAAKLKALSCHTMQVKEWKGDVVFLHEVAPGAADRSYGIHVGKLAGLPETVVARAEQVLETLEKGRQSGVITKLADDLPLFAALTEKAPPPATIKTAAAVEALHGINPDDLTPKEALDALYRVKGLLDG